MRDFARLESLPNQIEHLDELAEDENAMTAVDDLFQKFIQQVHFGRTLLVFVRRKAEQTQIATDLAEAKKSGQHFHPLRALAGWLRAESLLDLAQQNVVSRALGRTKIAWDDLLYFLGQLAGDVGFAPAQEKWAEAPGKSTLQGKIRTCGLAMA